MGFSEMLSLLVPLFHLVLPPVVLHPTTQPFSTGCFLSTSSFCSASFSPHRRSRWTPERNARDEQTVPLKRLSGLLGAAQPAKGFQNDFPPEGDLEEPTDEQKKVVVRRCSIRCPHCDKRCRRGSEFCSSCGAAVAAVNSDKMSLVDFVNDTFWPVRTSEVAHHTARVERGFWDQILPVQLLYIVLYIYSSVHTLLQVYVQTFLLCTYIVIYIHWDVHTGNWTNTS
eukprot:GHVS01077511.1.p2 GENE.GHVS01077511.1~~GHVS01077511.1.p2  ORF type:complete len:226 (-),score=25.13 GHVS01077511.1:994-1671(-)